MEPTARYQRTRRVCREMYVAIADRPAADQAHAINELIETYCTREVRLLLRNETYTERERYVGIRAAVCELREKFWTPEAWLELRLTKYIAMGVFRIGHKLLSMAQDEDGVWKRQVLVPRPSNLNRARQDHIYGPLPVPSPFRDPAAVTQAQRDLLKETHFEISPDGKACAIDPFAAANSTFEKANSNKNYDSTMPPRLQILCDAVGYFKKNRMATRFGCRIPNLLRFHNAKYYFSNISLFLGPDHYEDLQKYLSSIYKKLNAGLRMQPANWAEQGVDPTSSLFTTEVQCKPCDETPVEIVDGGDAACANAGAALEPPPSKRGCCYYCELRRVDWFDRKKCDAARRRTLFRGSLLANTGSPHATRGSRHVHAQVPGSWVQPHHLQGE